MKSNNNHTRTQDYRQSDDQHHSMSDTGREADRHDGGRRLMDPTRISRHLMSLKSPHSSDLGVESTRNVVDRAAGRHGPSSSSDGGAAQS